MGRTLGFNNGKLRPIRWTSYVDSLHVLRTSSNNYSLQAINSIDFRLTLFNYEV